MAEAKANDVQTRQKTATAALDALAAAQQDTAAIVRRQTKPWWMEAVPIALKCAEIVQFPVRAAIGLAEAAVSFAVLAVIGVGVAWYSGAISDKDVSAALKPLGQRILAIVQAQTPTTLPAPPGAPQ